MSKRFLCLVTLVLAIGLSLHGCGGGGDTTVVEGNRSPVADAGSDQNVATDTVVTLDGSSSSDADGDLLTYSWSIISLPEGSSAVLSDVTQVNPTFTPDMDGSYVVSLTVNDGRVDSFGDTVTITAATGNSAPVADAGPDQNVATGANVTLDGSSSSDADGDTLTYSWSITLMPMGSGAVLSDAAAANPTFIPDYDGSYVVSLTVNDGVVDSAEDTVTITAATGNSEPVANAGPDQNVATGSVVTLDGSSSSDADGDSLSYDWSFVSVPAGSNANLSAVAAVNPIFTADVDGAYVVRLHVYDGTLTSPADTVVITAATVNSVPVANAGPDQNVTNGAVVTLDASSSSDADGDMLTYSWSIISLPMGSGAFLSDATAINPTFTADLDGSYVVRLVVNDTMIDSTADTLTITAATGNSAPVANAGPDRNVATGTIVTLDGSSSSDADGDSLTYSWSFVSVPGGSSAALSDVAAINPTFTADLGGSYVLQLVVNDGTVDSATNTVTITAAVAPMFAYVTNDGSASVSIYEINQSTGLLSPVGAVSSGISPRSITVDPLGRFAYVANLGSDNLNAYSVDLASGELIPLGTTDSVTGSGPISVTADPSGKYVYAANSTSGSVASYSINQSTGELTAIGADVVLGPPNATGVTVDPSGKFVFAVAFPPGEISAFAINQSTGELTSTGAAVATGLSPVSVTVDPTGKFAYVPNGAANNVSAYTINQSTGELTAAGATAAIPGTLPITVTVAPSGKFAYVANYSSDNVSVYSMNQSTGELTFVETTAAIVGATPTSVSLDPTGKFAYMVNHKLDTVSIFTVDQTNGTLTHVGDEATGFAPYFVLTIIGSIP